MYLEKIEQLGRDYADIVIKEELREQIMECDNILEKTIYRLSEKESIKYRYELEIMRFMKSLQTTLKLDAIKKRPVQRADAS